MIDYKLLIKIKAEISEDFYRYDGDYETWSEVIMDHPSNTLMQLYKQIPEDKRELYFEEHIIPFIQTFRNNCQDRVRKAIMAGYDVAELARKHYRASAASVDEDYIVWTDKTGDLSAEEVHTLLDLNNI